MNFGIGSFEFDNDTYAFVLTDGDPDIEAFIHMKVIDDQGSRVFQNVKKGSVKPSSGAVILQKEINGQLQTVSIPAHWEYVLEAL